MYTYIFKYFNLKSISPFLATHSAVWLIPGSASRGLGRSYSVPGTQSQLYRVYDKYFIHCTLLTPQKCFCLPRVS